MQTVHTLGLFRNCAAHFADWQIACNSPILHLTDDRSC